MAFLSYLDIYNSRNIAIYRVFLQYLLDFIPILDHTALHILRALEAMIDYVISQKSN